jgi:hypothetical protein
VLPRLAQAEGRCGRLGFEQCGDTLRIEWYSTLIEMAKGRKLASNSSQAQLTSLGFLPTQLPYKGNGIGMSFRKLCAWGTSAPITRFGRPGPSMSKI